VTRNPAEICIDQPVVERHDTNTRRTEPTADRVAWRTIINALATRQFAGMLTANEDIAALIATSHTPDDGVIAAWNRTASPEDAHIEGYFGPGEIRVRDVFGNATTLPKNGRGEINVTLDDLPKFIEGVDSELTLFRNTLRLDPPMIQARAQRHAMELVVENPWNVTLSGNLRIEPPEGWEITPRIFNFSVSPGETQRLPLNIVLPRNAPAGPISIEAQTDIAAERRYPIFTLPIRTEVGLDEFRVEGSARVASIANDNFEDVIATVIVTNLSTRRLALDTFAAAPGLATQQNTLIIGPGQTVSNQFTFMGAADALAGNKVAVGALERNGTGRLNKIIEVP